MKVLFITNDYKTIIHFSINEYLKKHKHDYKIYNFRESNYYKKFKHLNNIPKGILFKIINKVKNFDNDLIKLIDSFKPELIFVIKGEVYYPDFWAFIKEKYKCKIINWFPDDPQLFYLLSKNLALGYDLFFINPKDSVKLYNKYGIYNVYQVCFGYYDKDFYKPYILKNKRKKYDLLFIGNCYPSRIKVLKCLQKKVPDLNIQFFGPRWKIVSNIFKLYSMYNKKILYYKNYFQEIQKTKIFINPPMTSQHINLKVFETMSFEVFGIHGYMKEAAEVFKEGKEIIFYYNLKDLIEKVKYYYHHENIRQQIIESAYKKVRIFHSAKKRLETISTLIKDKLNLQF